jgi:succinoglycan biosynthesis transport protein ExoP
MTPEAGNPKQDLRTILKVFWRWKVLFLVLLVVPPVAAYLLVRGKPKTYQSSALVALTATPGVIGQAQASQQNIASVARLVTTTGVAQVAAKLMKPPADPGSIAGEVSASADTDTGFITISATDHDPRRAAEVANAFASALSTHQQNVALTNIDAQIKTLEGQLKALPKRDPTRTQLVQQLAQLRGERGATGAGANVVQGAAPGAATGPHIRRDVEIGLVIGLLLAIGAVLMAENSDRRVRISDDLEDMTGLPMLSAIPREAFSTHSESAARAEESFQMLRSALTYFNVERRLSSVAIVSPEGQDGKTTVALGVARAAAKAGKRVVLIDADLRMPQVGPRLGLDMRPGLGAVLAGEGTLDEALVDIPIEAEHSGSLQVLPAGPPPPNPAALIDSEEMRLLIGRLENRTDLVVLDTAAALAVSDALPLVQWVSGVVVVVRINRSSRAAVRRLQRMIAAGRGTTLGAVATGVATNESYGYGYERYAAGNERRRRFPWRRSALATPHVPPRTPPGAEAVRRAAQ